MSLALNADMRASTSQLRQCRPHAPVCVLRKSLACLELPARPARSPLQYASTSRLIAVRASQSVQQQANPEASTSQVTEDPWGKCFAYQESGQIVTTVVTGFNKGGVLVQLEGLKGFIPYNQLDPIRLPPGHKGDFSFLVGQEIMARVVVVDTQAMRKTLVLSERQAVASEEMSKLKVGDVVEGTITRLEHYGAFVALEGSLAQGLVQLSDISWDKILTADAVLSIGQRVQAVVKDVSPARCRLSLSLKDLKADPLKQTVGSEQVSWVEATQPLPGVMAMMNTLREMPGIEGVALRRQAEVTATVSQELEVWLTREEVEDGFNVVVREGSIQQELHLSTATPRKDVVRILQAALGMTAASLSSPAA